MDRKDIHCADTSDLVKLSDTELEKRQSDARHLADTDFFPEDILSVGIQTAMVEHLKLFILNAVLLINLNGEYLDLPAAHDITEQILRQLINVTATGYPLERKAEFTPPLTKEDLSYISTNYPRLEHVLAILSYISKVNIYSLRDCFKSSINVPYDVKSLTTGTPFGNLEIRTGIIGEVIKCVGLHHESLTDLHLVEDPPRFVSMLLLAQLIDGIKRGAYDTTKRFVEKYFPSPRGGINYIRLPTNDPMLVKKSICHTLFPQDTNRMILSHGIYLGVAGMVDERIKQLQLDEDEMHLLETLLHLRAWKNSMNKQVFQGKQISSKLNEIYSMVCKRESVQKIELSVLTFLHGLTKNAHLPPVESKEPIRKRLLELGEC